MEFSHLFILQLRSWPRGLGPPDSDSGPDLFNLLILDLLIFDLLLEYLLAFDLLFLPLHPSAPMGLWRQCNFTKIASERPPPTSTLQGWHLPVPFTKLTSTSTLCEADTYQYPLQSQHLPVLIAKPSSTSSLWYEMTPSA